MSQVETLVDPAPKTTVRHLALRGLLPGVAMVLRLFVGGVFLWSSLPKLQQPYDFLSAVYNYDLVGAQTGLWVAALVPWLEFVTGISLLLGVWDRSAWVLAIVLLLVFTAAQASVAHRGLPIPCGCAPAVETVSLSSILNTGLLAVAALAGFSCSLAERVFRSHVPDSQPIE